METLAVEPPHPFQGCQLDLLNGSPKASFLISSVLNRANWDSAGELSRLSPLDPTDSIAPNSTIRSLYAEDSFLEPWSKWSTNPVRSPDTIHVDIFTVCRVNM